MKKSANPPANPHVSRRHFALGTAAIASAGLVSRRVRAAETFHVRVSLDTAPAHQRNVSFDDYLKKVSAASNGRITGQVFSAAALFSDMNVIKALLQGQVEMACPGTWIVTGFIPDCDVVNLPMMYGQPLADTRRALDGQTGAFLATKMTQKLRVHIPGPWLELGMQHWYSAGRKLTAFADLKGMKIRNAGGAALAWRTRFFGGIPNTTAWPDVPLSLSQGVFDALITTNESASSAKLFDSGVKWSLQDHQNLNCYIPMISGSFWAKLPADLKKVMTDVWAQNIGTYRMHMATAQDNALKNLEAKKVQVTMATDAEILAIRKRMLPDQEKLIKQLHMSPEIHGLLVKDLGNLV